MGTTRRGQAWAGEGRRKNARRVGWVLLLTVGRVNTEADARLRTRVRINPNPLRGGCFGWPAVPWEANTGTVEVAKLPRGNPLSRIVEGGVHAEVHPHLVAGVRPRQEHVAVRGKGATVQPLEVDVLVRVRAAQALAPDDRVAVCQLAADGVVEGGLGAGDVAVRTACVQRCPEHLPRRGEGTRICTVHERSTRKAKRWEEGSARIDMGQDRAWHPDYQQRDGEQCARRSAPVMRLQIRRAS